MSKPMRDIVILDGQWLRVQSHGFDWVRREWPEYTNDRVWHALSSIPDVTLSYVKSDGVAYAVRIYSADQSECKSGRCVMRYSTTPTPNGKPIFSFTRTVTQEEYDAMYSEIDEMDWSI